MRDEKAEKILKGLNQCKEAVGLVRNDVNGIKNAVASVEARISELDYMIEELRQELAIELADVIKSRRADTPATIHQGMARHETDRRS